MFKNVLLAGALLLAPVLAYGGSPNTDLSVQIVPAASPKPPSNGIACGYGLNYTGTIPAAAQAMGFTTCAANYDFTQPFYANLSNWLDCAGASSPQWWIQPYITSGEAPRSAFSIVNDGGNNTLDIHWDPSYFNGGNTTAAYIETANSGQTTGFFFPLNVYFEAKVRVPQASYNACNGSWCETSDLFTWTNPNIVPNALEWDIVEFGTDGGWASGGAPNYTHGASGSNPVAWQNQPTNGGTSNYNIYGNMINVDSSGNLYQCAYLTGVRGA